ncbi:MAG: GDSL-type esterase/lipase family protein [Proteobacteria bacterium]|nr:GDSL-type esterase/lipase family protein [Pseudomonadota bacterium]
MTRIVVYGASHVASDLFTGELRLRLQQRFGEAGPGFVLPAKPWRYYRNSLIEHEASSGWTSLRVRVDDLESDRAGPAGLLGLAGVAVEAPGAADCSLRTRSHGVLTGHASVLELYYAKQPGGGHLEWSVDGRPVGLLSTAATSWQTDYARIELADAEHRVHLRARGDGPVRVYGMTVERDRHGVIVDTVGIPGARARYQLLWNEALVREHLARRAPDLVVLAYGTNESGDDVVPIGLYRAQLHRVLRRVRDALPESACLLVGPSDRPRKGSDGTWGPRPRTGQVVAEQRAAARKFHCGFFDLVRFMGGPMSMVRWVLADPPLGRRDHVHFTRAGYEKLGGALFRALLVGYDKP